MGCRGAVCPAQLLLSDWLMVLACTCPHKPLLHDGDLKIAVCVSCIVESLGLQSEASSKLGHLI